MAVRQATKGRTDDNETETSHDDDGAEEDAEGLSVCTPLTLALPLALNLALAITLTRCGGGRRGPQCLRSARGHGH